MQQPAGRSDDVVRGTVDEREMFLNAVTARQECHSEGQKLSQLFSEFADLLCEFARGRQDQSLDAHLAGVHGQVLKQREQIRSSFARSCPRHRYHIPAIQDERDCFFLYGGWDGVSFLLHTSQYAIIETHPFEALLNWHRI